MAYAQTHYLQVQGINGRYRIDQIGCLLTAFCNLEADFGVGVDPVALNNYFVQHGTFVDVDDGIRDDLGWGSVSAFDGNTVVSSTGTGFPSSNQAIVKFVYINHAGQRTTHFAKVADAASHSILDSWDGAVKGPGAYEGYYGKPVAYATYAHSKPQPVVVVHNSPAPVSVDIHTKQLHLPANVPTWRVYHVGGPWTPGHEVGKLAPAKYGGLTYDIVGNPAGNIFTINTAVFGQVAIYAGPDTDAQFIDKPAPQVQAAAPTPPPAPAPAPEPTPAPASTPPLVATPSLAESVPVKVVPATPKRWQDSYQDSIGGIKEYTANKTVTVKDLEGLHPDSTLVKYMSVKIAGSFTGPDGKKYKRSAASVKNGTFYGIDPEVIEPQSMADDADLFDTKLANTLRKELGYLTAHEKKVETAAKSVNLIEDVKQLFHIGKKK